MSWSWCWDFFQEMLKETWMNLIMQKSKWKLLDSKVLPPIADQQAECAYSSSFHSETVLAQGKPNRGQLQNHVSLSNTNTT